MHDQPCTSDQHSFGNPNEIRVKHFRLNLTVDMEAERLHGNVLLRIKRQKGCPAGAPLVLDTKNLEISVVAAVRADQAHEPLPFHLDTARTTQILGTPLVITVPEGVNEILIDYATGRGAEALQWLPASPGGKKFLFTQSESIMARSWIPLQDSPAVRITYEANITAPEGLKALMAAKHRRSAAKQVFSFVMPYTIPSYLVALAVGDLTFRSLGARTGVYALPSVIDAAAWEFAQAEKMLRKAERRYGAYPWGRWDILVLPPAFPLGGMENPMLTFVTPTLLAGDRSLVDVLVHEMAHSWSGNTVTNATWRDFWLNEGFTTYLQRRLIEDLYGRDYADMQLVLAEEDLANEMRELPPADQILHIDVAGRDPDEALTDIAYEKGALFNRVMEKAFGRRRWDAFLRQYFAHFAFKSITTRQFEEYLAEHLLRNHPRLSKRVDVKAWIYEPGLPPHKPHTSSRLSAVEKAAAAWSKGVIATHSIDTKDWSAHEWLRFLRQMPALTVEQMGVLDSAFNLTAVANAEIAHQWLLMCVRCGYHGADERLASYLGTIGRRKLVLPLYKELCKTAEGKTRAEAIYRRSQHLYHFLVTRSVDEVLDAAGS